jgi:poly-gamma-glutamate synthesis protein (capsule biosynthesis protein)
MTGRGVDQILPHPSKPHLFEPYVTSALTYVELAEHVVGPIPRRVGFEYVWGDALAELRRVRPDARIVNLETSVTASEESSPDKGIHYRMHPANVPCLTAAGIDCCVLANNHILDWGRSGLAETLTTLRNAGIRTAGAGRDAPEAAAPAVIEVSQDVRVLVFGYGMETSGVLRGWRATRLRCGVNLIDNLSPESVDVIARQVAAHAQAADIVVASIHWGGNWGYEIPPQQREFAHRLIDAAGIDLLHGHSSHHVMGVEVYHGKAILYGCGDILNDYEGISGEEAYRGDLGLMYFPTLDIASGKLLRLSMTPTHMHHLRINRASSEGASWLFRTVERECSKLDTQVLQQPDGTLELQLS